MKEPIKKIRLKDGTVRYRLVVDIGNDEHGRRKQLTRTFDTPARGSRGTVARPARDEPGNICQAVQGDGKCLPGRLPEGRDSGPSRIHQAELRDALRPVREQLGTRPLQSITKSDVEDLVDWMLTAGRRRGGKPGTGLSGRTARLTLGRFSAALEMQPSWKAS